MPPSVRVPPSSAQVTIGARIPATRSRDSAEMLHFLRQDKEKNAPTQFKHPLDVSDEVLAKCSPEAMADVLAWRKEQEGKK